MADKILKLMEMKAEIRKSMGSPVSNANAAKALAGTRFWAENSRGERVIGTILESLSPKGKVQAELGCVVKDCKEVHIREQSDWHQSVRCRVHSSLARVTLTDQERTERKLERLKGQTSALEAQLSGGRRTREVAPPHASPNGH